MKKKFQERNFGKIVNSIEVASAFKCTSLVRLEHQEK